MRRPSSSAGSQAAAPTSSAASPPHIRASPTHGAWASPASQQSWWTSVTWSMANRMWLALSRASSSTGGPSRDPTIRPDAPPARWHGFVAAAQRHGQLRTQYLHHPRRGGIARLPRIPRRRHLLLALLHLVRLPGARVHRPGERRVWEEG